jgi:pentapeptide MXKDX repeat protein
MLKSKLSAAIVAVTLLACAAIVPVFARVQQDTMKNDRMGQDKMSQDKMAGNKMTHRRRRHRRHKKHMAGAKMDKMQGNKKM